MVTLDQIILTVRELTFDRFIVPGLALKAKTGCTLTINSTSFTIKDDSNVVVYAADLTVLTTFDKLAADLINNNIVISYTPYFNGGESTTNLMPVTNVSLANDYTLFRKYFFSDDAIKQEIVYYYYKVLCVSTTVEDLEDIVQDLVYPSERHLIYWVSYMLVDRRRLYEAAALVIGNTYTDGSNYDGSGVTSGINDVTVQIGSVFTIREDPTNGFFYEDFNRVGSDNVLGDKYSFWYRLLLWLRSKLEAEFGDYSLRPDELIQSDSVYQSNLNFRVYYDSYPFSISPLARDILSQRTQT